MDGEIEKIWQIMERGIKFTQQRSEEKLIETWSCGGVLGQELFIPEVGTIRKFPNSLAL